MATTVEVVIDTRKMRYTGDALAALKNSGVDTNLKTHDKCNDSIPADKLDNTKPSFSSLGRVWLESRTEPRPPQKARARHIGKYALTTEVAPWVRNALSSYKPTREVLELVRPFAAGFHELVSNEQKSSYDLHDIEAIEFTYQCTLEICGAILLAADATDDPVTLDGRLHASQAGGDDHFKSWGRLLTGLECDPPIIVQFPFYLFMCQSFTLEPNTLTEDYVYAALTGVDWVKGQNKFNNRVANFEALAKASVPTLDDTKSGEDRCFWRIALAYISAMNGTENARTFKSPKTAAIKHDLEHDLVIFARALDTMGSAYMCRDGAAWLDNEGMDSLIGSALPNDVMDLHTDIFTGETRNLLRLLYPSGYSIKQAMQTASTVLSTMLCEVFRGHYRSRMQNREDGRISSTSPPYSFSRARHRRIFETMELYVEKYPQFWEWTWEIYHEAVSEITEAGIAEPIICGLKRARTQGKLEQSPPNKYFHLWYDMVEDGTDQLSKPKPLGVSEDLAPVIRELHSLWHQQLLDVNKKPGWGRDFDYKSDMLLGEAGDILTQRGGIGENAYRFTIAYGRLSMGLPYVAYHTINAIIMAFGAITPVGS